MPIDYKVLFDRYGIQYVTSGPSVVRGNIAVKCPFCGPADPSEHMGIRLSDGAWGCWRNNSHRGLSPYRLLGALIGLSWFEIRNLLGGQAQDLSQFDQVLATLQNEAKPVEVQNPAVLSWPREIKPLDDITHDLQWRFFHYLKSRGFPRHQLSEIAASYKLRYAVMGAWKGRIIFPVEMPSLVAWTGRAITQSRIRYKTLSTNHSEDNRQALEKITDCLWNLPGLMQSGGKLLLVCEGPFDALKLDYYGKHLGVRATCLFTKNISAAQKAWLLELRELYDQVGVLLDRDATLDALHVVGQLQPLDARVIECPAHVKDPGDLNQLGARAFLGGVLMSCKNQK